MARRPVSPLNVGNPLAPAVTPADPFVRPSVQGPVLDTPVDFVAGLQAIADVSGRILGDRIKANDEKARERLLGQIPAIRAEVGRKLKELGDGITSEEQVRAINEILDKNGITRYDHQVYLLRALGEADARKALAIETEDIAGFAHPRSGGEGGLAGLNRVLAESKKAFYADPFSSNPIARDAFEGQAYLLEEKIRQQYQAIERKLVSSEAKREAIRRTLEGAGENRGLFAAATAEGPEKKAVTTEYLELIEEAHAFGTASREDLVVSGLEQAVDATVDPDEAKAMYDFVWSLRIGPSGRTFDAKVAAGRSDADIMGEDMLARMAAIDTKIHAKERAYETRRNTRGTRAKQDLGVLLQGRLTELLREVPGANREARQDAIKKALETPEAASMLAELEPWELATIKLDAEIAATQGIVSLGDKDEAVLSMNRLAAYRAIQSGETPESVEASLVDMGIDPVDRRDIMASIERNPRAFDILEKSGAETIRKRIENAVGEFGSDNGPFLDLLDELDAAVADIPGLTDMTEGELANHTSKVMQGLQAKYAEAQRDALGRRQAGLELGLSVEADLAAGDAAAARQKIAVARDSVPREDQGEALAKVVNFERNRANEKRSLVNLLRNRIASKFQATEAGREQAELDPGTIDETIASAAIRGADQIIAEQGGIPSHDAFDRLAEERAAAIVFTDDDALAPGEQPDTAEQKNLDELLLAKDAVIQTGITRSLAHLGVVLENQFGRVVQKPTTEWSAGASETIGLVKQRLSAGRTLEDEDRTRIGLNMLSSSDFNSDTFMAALWASNVSGGGLRAKDGKLFVPVEFTLPGRDSRGDAPEWALELDARVEVGETYLSPELLRFVRSRLVGRAPDKTVDKFIPQDGIYISSARTSTFAGFGEEITYRMLVPLPEDMLLGELATFDPTLTPSDIAGKEEKILGPGIPGDSLPDRFRRAQRLHAVFQGYR